MKKYIWIIILLSANLCLAGDIDTKIQEIESRALHRLKKQLESAGFSGYPSEILLLAVKESRKLILYGKSSAGFTPVKVYEFTGFSGNLGPKWKSGDGQIPEGIYDIEYLNPHSRYLLSLKIGYPNSDDMARIMQGGNPGGDIFLHGGSYTRGCIPVGKDAIEEIFLLSYKATRLPKIIITPRDFRLNSEYPIIDNIDCCKALYDKIKVELKKLSDEK